MRKIHTRVKLLSSLATSVFVLLLCMMMASCDYWHNDQEGCEAELRVQFVYDMNMKFADAFAHEVKTVTLHAFDSSGNLVYTKTEPAERIIADGGMNVDDLASGVYDLQVWAEGEDRHPGSYIYKGVDGDAGVGTSHVQDFQVVVDRANQHVDHDLTPLFHGFLKNADLTTIAGQTKIVTVKLTKDTNNFKVVLQHLSGVNLNANDFDFTITDSNGYLDYDNSLLQDEELTYPAWSKYAGQAGVEDSDTGEKTSVSVAVAELTTNRLVEGHNMRLHVYEHATGKSIINIPLIDYALLVKGNYNRSMSNQEYLDRQDTYDLVFFLDEANNWLASTIYVNSWRVVLSNSSMGTDD